MKKYLGLKLSQLSDVEFNQHITNVKSHSEEEQVRYLQHLIDVCVYDADEENQNPETTKILELLSHFKDLLSQKRDFFENENL
jgi:hypothetical protein